MALLSKFQSKITSAKAKSAEPLDEKDDDDSNWWAHEFVDTAPQTELVKVRDSCM
jgi:hypothetical protein